MVIEQLKALYEKLTAKNITAERLWDCYAIKQPSKVKQGTLAQLTDLVSLVRFELGEIDKLEPFADHVRQNFQNWTPPARICGLVPGLFSVLSRNIPVRPVSVNWSGLLASFAAR